MTAARDRVVIVWFLLIAATLISFAVGGEHLIDDKEAATVIVLLVAFLKVFLVGLYFMDLRGAPVALQAVFTTWTVVAAAGVCGIYLVA